MGKKSKFSGVVIVLSFIFLFGCSSSGSDLEIPPEADIKEGDIQTETYVIDGKEYTDTYKVYDLAEDNEEPVLVILPLESGDRIVNEINEFKDQTSASAAELKAFSYKYFLSVPGFVNLAKGKSSKKRSQINTFFDDLNELEDILNKFQEFGEDSVFTLSLILEEMDLSLKEFMSAGEEVFGDEYFDWIKENPQTIDQLYTDYILSDKETYKEFLEDDDIRSASNPGLGFFIKSAAYNIAYNGDKVAYNSLHYGNTGAVINPSDGKNVQYLTPHHRQVYIKDNYYGTNPFNMLIAHFKAPPFVEYKIMGNFSYRGESKKGYPGKYWIRELTTYVPYLWRVVACPIFTAYIPCIKTVIQTPLNVSSKKDEVIPEINFRIAVNCYIRTGLCIIKLSKNRTFLYKLNGKDGIKFLGGGHF